MGLIEIEQVLNLWLNGEREPTQEQKDALKLRYGRRENGAWGWISDEASRLVERAYYTKQGYVECPREGCDFWVEPSDKRIQQRVQCQKCHFTFCTRCTRAYHFGCTCDEVMTLSRLWLEWRERGLMQYLQEMAQQDSHYAQAMAEFQQKKQQYDRDVAVAAENFKNLQLDEQTKAQSARLCPHCGRVVQKLSGCDAMVSRCCSNTSMYLCNRPRFKSLGPLL